jgi:hypothetical protein
MRQRGRVVAGRAAGAALEAFAQAQFVLQLPVADVGGEPLDDGADAVIALGFEAGIGAGIAAVVGCIAPGKRDIQDRVQRDVVRVG